MARAIEISARALAEDGVRPFGAVIVRDGEIVAEGVNRALADHDPTSHGEIEAIRAACRALGTTSLKGCVLYTSCEPCAMCASAILIAELDRVVYGADLDQSRAAFARHPSAPRAIPLDSAVLRAEVGKPIAERAGPARQALGDEAAAVLAAYAAKIAG
ncbi:MAG: nucleoside deaminase [Pseudomonadota bacterium]